MPPPLVAALVGFEVEYGGEGWAVFGLEPGEHLYNPTRAAPFREVLHIGGTAAMARATLLDAQERLLAFATTTFAVTRARPAEQAPTTTTT